MMTILAFYFLLLGLIIGSFLNVVILRHNTGKTIGGRSVCMNCKTKLSARELIPLFSYLFQKGKCAHCKSKISMQYPMVELATGLLFIFNFFYTYQYSNSLIEFAFSYVATSFILAGMVAIFVYDMKHRIIPDTFSFTLFGVSLVYILGLTFVFQNPIFWTSQSLTWMLWNIFAGIVFYVPIYLLWRLSRGRLIGLGDAKLLLSIGTVLGLIYGLSAIFLAFWFGTLFAIFLLLKTKLSSSAKRITMKTEIAFGPFLIIAFLLVYFFHIDVTNLTFLIENF